MVLVQKFFCLKLRSAALVAVWLDVIKAIASLIILGIMVANPGEYAKKFGESFDYELQIKLIKDVAIFSIVIVCLGLLFTGLLFLGIIKREASYMMPWIVLAGIGVVISFISMVYAVPDIFSSWEYFGQYVAELIIYLLVAYYYAAVVSYYQTLKAESNGNIRNNV